jgi:hypothetical protein
MAASYTRNVFKVNEFPLIIFADPIISLYKTMCWGTDHVTKLASPLLRRVLFNQSRNFIYWGKTITTMNISCNSLTKKERGLGFESRRARIKRDVSTASWQFTDGHFCRRCSFSILLCTCPSPHVHLLTGKLGGAVTFDAQISYRSEVDFVFGMSRFQTSAQRPLHWLRSVKLSLSLTSSTGILWEYLKLGRNHSHLLTVRFTVHRPSYCWGLYGVSYGQGH